MSKVVQALLSGMFFTFILDFFLFLGIQQNYINSHEIALYYNILFADHQNVFLFFGFSFLLGYITLYQSSKISLIVLIPLFILVFSTLIKPIGNLAGELLLMKKNVILKTKNISYRGDILYIGRKNVTFYDYRLNKNLIFKKQNIEGEL